MSKSNVIGFALIAAVVILLSMLNGSSLVFLLNIPTFLGVLIGTIGAVMAAKNGKQSKAELLNFAGKSAWIMGIIIFIIGIISLLMQLDDPVTIGPNIAVGMISLLYGALIWLACLILSVRATCSASTDGKQSANQ